MTKAPAGAASLPRLRSSYWADCMAALVAAAGIYLAWAGHAAWDVIGTRGTPTCSWPLQVRGTASPAQAGLVRCYLRALASDDTGGLMVVAADIPPVRITKADFRYSADARAGLATAALTPNPSDDTFYGVTITYADGTMESTSMLNMIAMGGSSGWRMNIGTDASAGPSVPSAAVSPAAAKR